MPLTDQEKRMMQRMENSIADDLEKEIIWAQSTTGEDFQCVHVDFAREQQAEIEQLHRILEDRLNDLKIIGGNNEKLLRQIVELRQEIDRIKISNEQP